MTIVNLETITDMQSWCRTLPPNGSSRIRAKQTSQETHRSLQKFLEPERKPKVIYTDNSLEFGKACEDLSWNHCTSTPHLSETRYLHHCSSRSEKNATQKMSRLDALSFLHDVIKKGRLHGARHGKTEAQKEHFVAHNARNRCIKKEFDEIHDRIPRDPVYRDSQLKIGLTEEKCIAMEKRAQEDHSYCPSSEEYEI